MTKEELYTHCKCCGKRLKTYKSRLAGYGSTCLKKKLSDKYAKKDIIKNG